MKNPKMLKLFNVNGKTKNMCQHAVKKLPFVIRYFSIRYKILRMCNKSILENGETLKSIPDWQKNH